MTADPLTDFPAWCRERGACKAGQVEADQCRSVLDFWPVCARGDWMAWVLCQLPGNHAREQRLFAGACVRDVWRLLTDDRSRHAVEVAERHAEGRATGDELAWAARAARAARAASAARAARAASVASAAALATQSDHMRRILPAAELALRLA